MDINQFTYYHFLGVGGIGMSALARYFKKIEKTVDGYDQTPSTLTKRLEIEGIAVYFEKKNSQLLQKEYPKDKTLVVYTPAVPDDFPELVYFREHNYIILKRAEVLGLICKNYKNISVAGSHGKTTTSTLLAHLFTQSFAGCNAFLGGISNNYETNYISNSNSDYVITEADEYDRSFLKLNPYLAIITSIDIDHLDIYKNKEILVENFHVFAKQIRNNGTLILNNKLKDTFHCSAKTVTYGLTPAADFWSEIVNYSKNTFTFHTPTESFYNLQLGIPGEYNIENATAALTVFYLEHGQITEVAEALKIFRGNQRRFDIHFRNNAVVYIDDYAHHPNELKAIISSVKKLYPNETITGIFQPHLFTRTRDLVNDFAEALAMLDKIILLDIYPAREKPLPNITSQWLLNKINSNEKLLLKKEEIVPYLSNIDKGIIITLGAGDIDRLVPDITKMLTLKFAGHES